ncbi:MAG: hypothetical protein K8S54_14555 [Spirochaetia bacterium]|nr:hypothetical protein [Spirochaetia bacterium]
MKKTGKTALDNEAQIDQMDDGSEGSNGTPVPELRVENPNALYEDVSFRGKPETAFEKLQHWSHRHKRKLYAVFLLAVVSTLFAGFRSTTPDSPQKLMDQYFARFGGHSDDWQYSIDRFHFTRAHLATVLPVIARYTLGNRGALDALQDKSTHDVFARDQFETDLLVYAAMQEDVLREPDARTILENALRHAIADYYVQRRLESINSDYRGRVEDAEALSYYEKNQDLYNKNGVAKGKALELIRTTLSGLKREEQRQEMRIQRAKLIARIQERLGPKFRGEKE